MRVALDATHALDRNPSGVGVYSLRLIEELAAASPETHFTLAYRSNRLLRALRAPKPGENCSRALLEAPFTRLWASGVDVFHGLNQRVPAVSFPKTVTTFHDLFVMTGDYSTPDYRERFTRLAQEAAARSDRIISVSAFTADQVSELLGFPRERIDVVPHGVDPPELADDSTQAAFLERLDLNPPVVLHVGAVQHRKNVVRLVEAFEGLDGAPTLVLAGGDGYGAEEIFARIESSPASGRIRRLGYVDSETRRLLYQTAAVLAFPSLDEGFGIPILEAMAAGLPVVCSDRSAMPEVAGDAARLVDPTRVEAIREGLAGVLNDADLADEIRNRGAERAAGFTWRRAAERTLESYRRA